MAKRANDEQKRMYGEFAAMFWYCWNCAATPNRYGQRMARPASDIAHIIGGPGRSHDRRNIIRLCRDCHRAQHGERWPGSPKQLTLANMLWLKKLYDEKFYDRKYLQSQRIRSGHLPPARRPE